MESHGHSNVDARRIKDLIEGYQHESRGGAGDSASAS
jgi:hypothetical protein